MTEVFAWSEEQDALREVVADYCRRHPAAPQAAAGGPDPELWHTMAERLSVTGLGIDPELGGVGGTLLDVGVVAEECARALVPTPVVSTLGAVATILRGCQDSAEARAVLSRIAAGTLTAAAVLTDADGVWDPDAQALVARRGDDGWQVSGRAGHVPDAGRAGTLVCQARTDADSVDDTLLVLVDASAAGVAVEPLTPLDQGRDLAHLVLWEAPGTVVARGAGVRNLVESALDAAACLVAVEQVGVAAAMLERSVEHARTRVQFGRAIGSFQAVKHRLVDMYVAVEHARSAAYYALWAVSQDGVDDPRLASSLAFTVASRAAREVTRSAVQVHGGVGFTWEHAAHRHLKTALSNSMLLGGTQTHDRRLADLALATSRTEVIR